MTTVNEHGFEILKDSQIHIEATARISEHEKFMFLGYCTFERKYSPKYGTQIIISLWQREGEYPRLERTDYAIKRGRIEIIIPIDVAKRMGLVE